MTSWSAGAEALYGWRQAEVLGRSLTSLTVPDAELPRMLSFVKDVLETGSGEDVTRRRRRDGSAFVAHVTVVVLSDPGGRPCGLLSVTRDVSEVAPRITALSPASLAEGVVVQRADGAIVECNRAAERLLGLTADQMKGRTSVDPRWLAFRDDGSPFPGDEHPAMVTLRTGQPQRGVVMGVHRPDGALTWISINSEPVGAAGDGSPSAVVATFVDITAQRAHRDALLDQARLRGLSDRINEIEFVLDPHGAIVEANDRAAASYGYGRDELLTLHLRDLRTLATAPDVDEQLRAAATPEGTRYETEHRRKDGSTFPAEVSSRLFVVGGVSYLHNLVRDLTEQRRAEIQLRRSAERLAASLEGTRAGLWEWEIQTGAAVFDERWAEIVGYTLAELEPVSIRTWIDLCHPDDLEASDRALQRCFGRETEYYDCECRMRHKDGSWVWVHDRGKVTEWGRGGEPVRMIGTHVDITERKRAEADRLEHVRESLRLQRRESLANLAGGVAHDFSNLLTAMLGNISLALAELPPSSPCVAYLEEAERAGRRAGDLSRQMRAYSGRGQFNVDAVRVADVVRQAMAASRCALFPATGTTLRVADPLPAVRADASQLVEAFVHVIDNALEAVGERGGRVAITVCVRELTREDLSRMTVDETSHPGAFVCVRVDDTGPGMAGETLARIFEPFFSTRFTGRGLGLAAVLGIVTGHGGAIDVRSDLGRGTTVDILLPVADPGAEGPELASQPQP